MINPFLNQMRQQVANVLSSLGTARMGIVNTFGPGMNCTVEYQPANEDGTPNLSPVMPIASVAIGNGFGVMFAPRIGDQVTVLFEAGDKQLGIVFPGIFSDADVPPDIESGEYYLIHESGSFIKFTKDGKLSLNGDTEIDMSAPVLNITITGAATINAQTAVVNASTSAAINSPSISLGNGGATAALAIFTALKSWADTHTHPQSGGGDTGAPNQLLSTSAATTIVKGQ